MCGTETRPTDVQCMVCGGLGKDLTLRIPAVGNVYVCRLAIGSADGNVHCVHARSSDDECPCPAGSEADTTCLSKQRPRTDVACTRWSLCEDALGVYDV